MTRGRSDERRPRMFWLGAGFSVPAGLPMSADLLDLVFAELEGLDNAAHLASSLEEYRRYRQATEGDVPPLIDIEDFAAYLDYEHHFGMLGSDTWSRQGNRSQLQLRWGIGRVLHRRTPRGDELPTCYLRFAEQLRGGDTIVTFNYDRVLEPPWRRSADRTGDL